MFRRLSSIPSHYVFIIFYLSLGGYMDFDNVFEKVKKGLKDSAALSIEKIEEYTKVGKLKIEEFSAKRKIERNYVDIGERVYELISEKKGSEIEKDIIVSNAIDNVNNLKEELVEIEKNIQEVTEESKEKSAEAEDEVTGI
jgi:hypothetical protein